MQIETINEINEREKSYKQYHLFHNSNIYPYITSIHKKQGTIFIIKSIARILWNGEMLWVQFKFWLWKQHNDRRIYQPIEAE